MGLEISTEWGLQHVYSPIGHNNKASSLTVRQEASFRQRSGIFTLAAVCILDCRSRDPEEKQGDSFFYSYKQWCPEPWESVVGVLRKRGLRFPFVKPMD